MKNIQTVTMKGKPGASIYCTDLTGEIVGSCLLDKRAREGWSVTHVASAYRVAKRFKSVRTARGAADAFDLLLSRLELPKDRADIIEIIRADRSGCVRDFVDTVRQLGGMP